MTVLVTGGAGYIGSHMVLELRDAGETVAVIDNLSTGFDWAVPEDVPLHVGNIGDQEFVRGVLRERKIDAIIHFAGSIIVPESVENPLLYYRNNTANTRNLIEVAVECGITRFIFSSTAAVYGNPEENPVSEDARLFPLSPYGRSKLMSEEMMADVATAHDFEYVALRYFNVAGADPAGRGGQSTPRATHLIKVACETALGRRPKMQIFGTDYPTPDGTCIRDYIHVKDLAMAHVAALEHLRRGGKSNVFNCGYSRGFSVREVISAVKSVSGVDFEVELAPARAGDPAAIIAKSDKIRTALGWRPAHADLEGIVRNALDWERHLMDRQKAD
ncbi:UDP-glucose 4-epimerase GalE [Rhodospira trueperi]|uniref:UDP-glucose 4-epimerase n=1 Tax=Rhodospira trueperi TaxID=69960 RepID=A0A1G7FQI7_9PROT|nr:UDP-glucose 4-epimerase GalE [Rhodospira trueperi]SDE78186.1 UDP-glucose 4-epimerase [Rhodospira trueperi]